MTRFLKCLYLKLFRVNDSPQKIALGFGLGAFSGIFPGTGPIAALTLAFILRANRASALLGSLLTNTWLSFLTFILATKTGSLLIGMNWQEVHQDWLLIYQDFHWLDFFKLSILKIIFPVMLGYLIIGLSLGCLVYLLTLIIIQLKNKRQDA